MHDVITDVEWLIFKSGVLRSEIARETGISQSTLSRLYRGEQEIKGLKAANIFKLYEMSHREYRQQHSRD